MPSEDCDLAAVGGHEGPADSCPVEGSVSRNLSQIDNIQLSHHHFATDYRGQGQAAGCGPCAGDMPDAALPAFGLRRIHRYKDFDHQGSFGPGVFCQYDLRLHLMAASGGNDVVELWDPANPSAIDLVDDGTGSGTYRDQRRSSVRGLQLYTSAALDTAAATRDAAAYAVVTAHDEARSVFELIDLQATVDASYRAARLVRIEDPDGNALSIAYAHAHADVTDGDYTRLWNMSSVTDAYGETATFTYRRDLVGWVIESAALPNGQTVTYTYDDDPMVGLTGVHYPDGSASSFTSGLNLATGTLAITIDDAGAEGTHRRKHLQLTQAIWDGASQPANRVRRVTDFEGGLVYANWITQDPNDPERITTYVTRGGDSLMRFTHRAGVPEKTERAIAWDPAEPDPTTYTWEVIADYTADGKMRNTGATRSTGLVVDRNLDPVTGAVVGVAYKNPQDELLGETLTSYNTAKQPTLRVDRYGRATTMVYEAARPWLRTSMTKGLQWNAGAGTADPTGDEGTWSWTYRADGQLATATDANLNVTDYVYYPDGRLHKVIEPADESGGARPETVYTYTAFGMVETVTDPVGRVTTYGYDSRNRITTITYNDSSTERFTYGTGAGDGIGLDNDANLLVRYRDRNGNREEYRYDEAGRRVYAALIERHGTALPAPDRIRAWSYVPGTELVASETIDGQLTEYTYDARLRLVGTTQYPQGDGGLALSQLTVYDAWDRVAYRQDAYGRRAYQGYDIEGRPVRTVRELLAGAVTAITADPTADPQGFQDQLAAITRDGSANPGYVVEETDYLPVPGSTTAISDEIARTIDGRGVIHSMAYDWQARVSAMVNADAQLTNPTTNDGLITDLAPPLEGRVEYDYDAQGNIVELRGPRFFDSSDLEGHQKARTRHAYTGRNLRRSTTVAPATAVAATETFTYFADGRLSYRRDARGNDWRQLWHACCGRLQAEVDPLGNGRIFNTDYEGNVTHEIVAGNLPDTLAGYANWHDAVDADTVNEITTRYDQRHRPTHQTVWLGARGVIDDDSWDATNTTFTPIPIAGEDGIPASEGLTTRWEYDDDLTVIDLAFPAAAATTYTVDLTGITVADPAAFSAVAERNPENEVVVTIRDGLGRVVKSYDGQGNASTVIYDQVADGMVAGIATGLVGVTATDANGNSIEAWSDGAGRVRVRVDALDEQAHIAYDANGNAVRVRDANGIGHDCVFDARNRQVRCVDTLTQGDDQPAVGDETETLYDAAGNVLTAIDGRDQSQTCVYDARGRRTRCTDRLTNATDYEYDAVGNQTAIVDAEGGRTEYVYDTANRKISERYPGHDDLATWGDATWDRRDYAYDAGDRLVERRDQTGAITTFAYDFADRLRFRRYPDGLDDELTYDAASRMTGTTSARYQVSTGRSYHDDGTLAGETVTVLGETYAVGYGYDSGNRTTALTYPDGSVLERGYTVRDQLASLGWQGEAGDLLTLTYDAGGRENVRSYGNGIQTQRSYRGDNLVEDIDTIAGGAIIDFHYDYDANKRKTAEVDGVLSASSQTFGYDDEDRLTTWTRTGPGQPPALSQSWDLSDVGDWQSTTIDGVVQNRAHNAVHELTTIDGAALSYDPKGNLTLDGDGQAYSWDYENRLRQAVTPGGEAVTYRYDVVGRPVAKAVDDGNAVTTTVFAYAESQVLAEYQGGAPAIGPEVTHVYGDFVDDLVVSEWSTSGARRYLHANHLLSVAAVTDAAGGVIERYAYDAHGDRTVLDAYGTPVAGNLSTIGQDTGFTGRRYVSELELWYFRARFYDSEFGRFIGRDPLGYADGMSLYRAVFAPNQLDPTGTLGAGCKTVAKALGRWLALQKAVRDQVHAGCLPEEMFTQVTEKVAAQNENWRKFGCWEEERAEIQRDYYLRNTKIVLQATADVTSYVPGAGQTISRAASGGLVVVALVEGEGEEAFWAATGVLPGGSKAKGARGASNASASLGAQANRVAPNPGGVGRAAPAPSPTGETKRVGRWMHPDEHRAMRDTGRVQQGGGGQTRVADPANPEAYRNAPVGDEYVEFDVPADRVLPHSQGTGRIPGPDSPDARLHQRRGGDPADFEMPPATNIQHGATRIR